MIRWSGKLAVVTGASSGIGARIAIDLANVGVKVIGLSRRVERIEQLKSNVKSEYQNDFHARKCDVGNENSVKEAFSWIEKNHGGIHIIVNNAGCQANTNVVDENNTQLLKNVIDTNLWGVVFGMREAYQSMKRHNINDGHIISINSICGHYLPNISGIRSFNVYPATKHALTALTEIVRRELRDLNTKVKVTSISPGLVETEIFDDYHLQEMEKRKTPILSSADVSSAVLYALGTPPHVQVHEMIIKPLGEQF